MRSQALINAGGFSCARRYWREAGLDHKIALHLAPALATLDALLRPGDLIVVDNVLWSGKVADPAADDDNTRALRAFNEALPHDPRIDLSVLPVADGMTLARKRETYLPRGGAST